MRTLFSLSQTLHRSCSKRPLARRRLTLQPLEDRLCLSYSTIDLGTLGGTYSEADAVNVSGQVVGRALTAAGDQHAFRWQNGTMTDLGTLGGAISWAGDINDSGQVVGASHTAAGSTVGHAFLWQSGIMTDLGTLGSESSFAAAINNHAQIVGGSRTAGGVYHAFVWEGGVMYDLNNFLPANSGWELGSGVADINDNAQVVGTGVVNGQNHAFRLTDNDGVFANGGAVIIDLGTIGGSQRATATGINTAGQVVGWSGNTTHAFRYSSGVMTDLKTLIGNPTIGVNVSYANAINDAGQIVGNSSAQSSSTGDGYHAFQWQNGKMIDLNKQLPRGSAWELETAYDINGPGQIVGYGRIGGQRHAFLMSPSGSALQAVAVGTTSGAESLSPNQVQPLLAEALARWQAAGADTSSLNDVNIAIADLGGTTLGLAFGHTITLDDNAAGWGWFIDVTPNNDSEFTKAGNQGEQKRIDLLTVVMHELGHLMGRDHDADGVMADTLAVGVRRTDMDYDQATLADRLFKQSDDDRPDARLGTWLTEDLESMRLGGKRNR